MTLETKEQEDGLLTSESSELDEFLDSIAGIRQPIFRGLARAMLRIKRPVLILETGCMRKPTLDPANVDGCSTLIWDWVAKHTEGNCITIDINPQNVEYTKTKVSTHTQVICADSVRFLSNIQQITRPIDFLYLDSMDFQGDVIERGLSALHHAAELSSVWQWLNPGALIAVDDCHEEYSGKHAIVRRFFDLLGTAPLIDNYITVWQKPVPTTISLVP